MLVQCGNNKCKKCFEKDEHAYELSMYLVDEDGFIGVPEIYNYCSSACFDRMIMNTKMSLRYFNESGLKIRSFNYENIGNHNFKGIVSLEREVFDEAEFGIDLSGMDGFNSVGYEIGEGNF